MMTTCRTGDTIDFESDVVTAAAAAAAKWLQHSRLAASANGYSSADMVYCDFCLQLNGPHLGALMHTSLAVASALPITLSPDLFSKMRCSSVVLPEPRNPDSSVTGRRVSCKSLMASISLAFVLPFDLVRLLAEDESRLSLLAALLAVGLADLAAGLPAVVHATAAGQQQQQGELRLGVVAASKVWWRLAELA
jgi:hypothetical protein